MACRASPGRSPAHVIGNAVIYAPAHDASLSLTSRTERGGYVIAALRGELGIASAPALREQLLSLLRPAASQPGTSRGFVSVRDRLTYPEER